MVPFPRSPAVRLAILAVVVAIAVWLVIWHGPDTSRVADAFEAVSSASLDERPVEEWR